MGREFLTYVENLYASETVEGKFSQLEGYIESLGFEGVLYTFIPSLYGDHSVPDFIPVYMTSRHFNQDYLNHYAAAEFSRNDPFIAAVVSGEKLSIDWWASHDRTPYQGSALEVIQVACRIFHDHLSTNLKWHLPFLYPISSQMNKTEQKVLKFILDGGAVKQLPEINVSERYGYNVMRHIRKGFGFRSNEQMIHRLTRLGVTEILDHLS